MGKTILFIHGRSFKPPKTSLRKLWFDALLWGLERDRPAQVKRFKASKKEFVYYGDLSNKLLRSQGWSYNATADIADRKKALTLLKAYAKNQFTKASYRKIPGRRPYKQFLADILGGPLNAIRLGEGLISSVAPDMARYWNLDKEFGSQVRATMVKPLQRAMDRGDKILVVSHSLGTLIAYDTFWKFSRMGEYRSRYSQKKIDLWITMGSPLADETTKRHLRGSGASNERRYPSNIKDWANVAAEDDFISHDERVANDYKRMKKMGLVDSITDYRIYNLTIRKNKSNPHSSAGYLIHPDVVSLVADWLQKK